MAFHSQGPNSWESWGKFTCRYCPAWSDCDVGQRGKPQLWFWFGDSLLPLWPFTCAARVRLLGGDWLFTVLLFSFEKKEKSRLPSFRLPSFRSLMPSEWLHFPGHKKENSCCAQMSGFSWEKPAGRGHVAIFSWVIKGEKLAKIRGKNPNKQNFQSQASMSRHRSGVCSLCGSQHGSKAEHERL